MSEPTTFEEWWKRYCELFPTPTEAQEAAAFDAYAAGQQAAAQEIEALKLETGGIQSLLDLSKGENGRQHRVIGELFARIDAKDAEIEALKQAVDRNVDLAISRFNELVDARAEIDRLREALRMHTDELQRSALEIERLNKLYRATLTERQEARVEIDRLREALRRIKTAAVAEHASLHIPGFHPGCQLCAALDEKP